MVTIETFDENSQELNIPENIDLDISARMVAQIETWWKKGKDEAKNEILKWEIWRITQYLDNYEWLDSEILKLILQKWNNEQKDSVAQNLRNFLGNDKYIKNEIASMLISSWRWNCVANQIDLFDEKMHNNIAHKLVDYPQKFTIDNWIKIVTERDSKEFHAFYLNIKKFKWLDKYIANKILKLYFNRSYSYYKWQQVLAENLKSFTWLDKNIADTLIKKWYLKEVIKNNTHFDWISYKYFIEKWEIKEVINNLEQFDEIDEKDLLNTALDVWVDKDFLIERISKFKKINQVEFINKLIDLWVDKIHLIQNIKYFDESWKKHLNDIRKEINYRYVKDIDWNKKPCEEIESRINEFITNVELPILSSFEYRPRSVGKNKLNVKSINTKWWDCNVEWFYITVNNSYLDGGKICFTFEMQIDKNTWEQTLKIPWLEWISIKNNDEFIRIIDLLIWLENDAAIFSRDADYEWYYWWQNWKLRRWVNNFIDTTVLKSSTLKKYFPSIKNNEEFLKYINWLRNYSIELRKNWKGYEHEQHWEYPYSEYVISKEKNQ